MSLVYFFVVTSFSLTFGFFTKVSFKTWGSLYHDDDQYLTEVAKIGLLCAAFSFIIWAFLMQWLGFKNVYVMILVLQIAIILSFSSVSHDRTFYKAWIAMAWILESGNLTIIRPFIHSVYGFKIGN